MLQVQQVSKWFDQRRSVDEISFEMTRGEIVGFLGPNGAGKTTTMRMITGYLTPSAGKIWVDGLPMHEQSRQARSKIGYLPETPPLYPDMTVRSYLRFIADLRDVPAREQKLRISEMVDRLGLEGRERQVIRSLSKGYKQRVGLAGAIIHQPELLILDEPTSGLDPNQIMEIRQLIRELGEQHTVLLSTHILPEVSMLCNRMLIIHEGKLVLDRAADHIGSSLHENFQVQLEVKSKPAIVRSVLEHEPFAHTELNYADTNEQQEQLITIKLTGVDHEDFRESLSLLLAEARIPVLEMRKERQSLEDVFAKLTTHSTYSTDSVSDKQTSTDVEPIDPPLTKEDTSK